MRNHSNENEFDLHENGRAGETHFHMNGFARRLVMTQRQQVTRKWPILNAAPKESRRFDTERTSCQKLVNYEEDECRHCPRELAAAFGGLINGSSKGKLSLRSCTNTRNNETAKRTDTKLLNF